MALSLQVDVAVIGAGPAGSACALSLRRRFPHLSVALLEAGSFETPRLGEVLSAQALPLLRGLGVDRQSLQRHGMTAESMATTWGTHAVEERHTSFSAAGTGILLQRPAFDAALATHARDAGAVQKLHSNLREAVRADGAWQLRLGDDGWTCSATYAVDATGRSAVLARAVGARTSAQDRLMAYSAVLPQHATAEHATMVEAVANGWWYTSPLPDSRRVVCLLTDVDLARNAGLPDVTPWGAMLRETRHIASLCELSHEVQDLTVAPAASTALDRCGGNGWIAAGDALASCDPLAGQGITRALYTGILASFAVADALQGHEERAIERFSTVLSSHRDGYSRMHTKHYASEQRWPNSPFWQRRHASLQETRETA